MIVVVGNTVVITLRKTNQSLPMVIRELDKYETVSVSVKVDVLVTVLQSEVEKVVVLV